MPLPYVVINLTHDPLTHYCQLDPQVHLVLILIILLKIFSNSSGDQYTPSDGDKSMTSVRYVMLFLNLDTSSCSHQYETAYDVNACKCT